MYIFFMPFTTKLAQPFTRPPTCLYPSTNLSTLGAALLYKMSTKFKKIFTKSEC